ncbi:hypothetical protein GGTG_02908 [Gaeumannomyces tritici R3-111a-1]|uniref:Uncharacterized protein n=1 Tax=Gaeumannomyces tritici (strain R3-111a-1) TaxID=644352 RepID=J3NNQ1_GAET3|nr:hypothetical protein GGTG_02908 [Gaeumannomyces tritici R3-111a-1]EJT77803.1 hypothetical protein GGTG_02908 [Gaeumannomyces tritici R3-111a-1]
MVHRPTNKNPYKPNQTEKKATAAAAAHLAMRHTVRPRPPSLPGNVDDAAPSYCPAAAEGVSRSVPLFRSLALPAGWVSLSA